MDKLMVWSAWGLMAAVGSLSVWKISQAPKIEPEIVRLGNELTALQNSRSFQCPGVPQAPVVHPVLPSDPKAGTAPAHDWTAFIRTEAVGKGVPPPITDVFILPLPKVSGETKADLDGVTIRWDLDPATVKLLPWMRQKDSTIEKFLIERQCEDGSVEVIAEVGPKVRSFTDLSTEARQTYRYWVSLVGKETDLSKRPLLQRSVTKSQTASAEARTPSATRLKLVGGEKTRAIFRVETYNRTQKKWIPKTVMAAPGQENAGMGGWSLKGLRFDNFTLVADLTDDEGVDRVLTTKD
jgi:hypothetical protein